MRQLTCILIALAIVGVYADEPEKLVNGIPTSIEENPQAVSIRMNNQHICGGTIINNRFILTAAHCIQFRSTQGLTVVTGTTYLNQGGVAHRIERWVSHENYNPNYPGRHAGFDIGLIKLATPITFNRSQQLVGLPKSNSVRGEGVTIVAWGSVGFRQAVHNNLQKLNAQVMLQPECQTRHQNFMEVHPNEFCTLIRTGTGTCNGDSGSGVIRNSDRTIIGLVSGGRPCAQGYPDVYTDVSRFTTWIQNKMNIL
ncbi:chymotrypsin-2-like isoform X2 [Nylanderia fulva]|uniref:chymotrypsin-2-like isoform X2 n=1 Tax=Nylanderia fulva TaxID=613905 RepID=UPI0010FADFD4|nr:chymotrypsin-2-like isoform X2 [Nylanderia fulva]